MYGKIWLLVLSDMRCGKYEYSEEIFAWAKEKETLEKLLEKERTEPYRDDRFNKNYKQGGPLEWANPPYEDGTAIDGPCLREHDFDRVINEHIDRMKENYCAD